MVQKLFPYGISYLNDALPSLFPFQNTIFTTATVQQLLFDGIPINCSHTQGPGKMVCNGMKGRITKTIRKLPDSSDLFFSFFFHVSCVKW